MSDQPDSERAGGVEPRGSGEAAAETEPEQEDEPQAAAEPTPETEPQGAPEPGPGGERLRRFITVRQAAFIGVGLMVGAGIFSLLGAAGAVAGAAVWLSFAFAGAIAGLQGYSLVRFGARYPSAGGLPGYVTQGFGAGHMTGIVAWLVYAVYAVVTAMIASSFGSYTGDMFAKGNAAWVKAFAVLLILVMTAVNVAGSRLVARVQTVVVAVVTGILLFFSIVTLINIQPDLLAPSAYPPLRNVVSCIALAFMAFLGFGLVTFAARDLRDPSRALPKAIYLALGIATCVCIAVSLGVFGTLTVERAVSSGGTAIAVAAEPVLGRAGYWLMAITALLATAGATTASLYPAEGVSRHLAETRVFPALMGRRFMSRFPAGLVIAAAACVVVVLSFDLNAIASIGGAVTLVVFALVTVAHLRVYKETGAKLFLLLLALITALVALFTFIFTSLDRGAAIALLVIMLACVMVDFGWTRFRDTRSGAGPDAADESELPETGSGAAAELPHDEVGGASG